MIYKCKNCGAPTSTPYLCSGCQGGNAPTNPSASPFRGFVIAILLWAIVIGIGWMLWRAGR